MLPIGVNLCARACAKTIFNRSVWRINIYNCCSLTLSLLRMSAPVTLLSHFCQGFR